MIFHDGSNLLVVGSLKDLVSLLKIMSAEDAAPEGNESNPYRTFGLSPKPNEKVTASTESVPVNKFWDSSNPIPKGITRLVEHADTLWNAMHYNVSTKEHHRALFSHFTGVLLDNEIELLNPDPGTPFNPHQHEASGVERDWTNKPKIKRVISLGFKYQGKVVKFPKAIISQ